MSSGFAAVQLAVRERLKDAMSVYDVAPLNAPRPYCIVSSDTASNADTKTYNSVSHSITLDLYSAERGLVQVKTLMDTIYSRLHRWLPTVPGLQPTPLMFEFSDSFPEPEGSRGVLRFSMRTA